MAPLLNVNVPPAELLLIVNVEASNVPEEIVRFPVIGVFNPNCNVPLPLIVNEPNVEVELPLIDCVAVPLKFIVLVAAVNVPLLDQLPATLIEGELVQV